MAGLQQRLDAAFGALGAGAEAPAWKPSQQQIFRSGAPVNDGNSSDEEYEERQRRETVPGAAGGRAGGGGAGLGRSNMLLNERMSSNFKQRCICSMLQVWLSPW